MRKMLVIVLFVMLNLVQHLCKAQSYIPFPDSNAVWINADYTLVNQPFYHYVLVGTRNYCTNGEDTLLNATTYTKINHCEGAYKAALRDDNGKVYIVPKDSVNEFLLYDFTLEVGDTLGTFFYEYSGGWQELSQNDIIINEVDSININNVYHKRITVDNTYWIEGIGCTMGLFSEPYTNVSGYLGELMCMSQNDTTLYPQVAYSSCLLPIGIEESMNNTITLYPNPAATQLTITGYTPAYLKLSNTLGQTVAEATNTNTLWLGTLPQGLYVLQLFDAKGGLVRAEKVVKR